MRKIAGLLLMAGSLTLPLLACNSGSSGDDSAVAATPQAPAGPLIEGPVKGGLGMISVSSTMFPLVPLGYSAEEYFVSGNAGSFVAEGDLPTNGFWRTRATGESAAYKTRIVVYRPKSARNFNGTVVVEWLNVSGGLDSAPGWINAHTEFMREGYAWVGVTAQKEGIDGGGPIGMVDLPLKKFDLNRYGVLQHPGNQYSYDIFTQAARLLRQHNGADPLAGLTIKKMIASGESQSAMRLVTYVNGIAPLNGDRLFDGYLIHSRTFGSAPLLGDISLSTNTNAVMRVRTDIAPVLTVQTESDIFLLNYYGSRQEDGPNFRLWEIPGTSHADLYTLNGLFDINGSDTQYAEVAEVKKPMGGIMSCAKPVNSGPQHFVISAAYAALNKWLTQEVAPATAPRMEANATGTDFVRDSHGNVKGGIRTPYVDVPTATLSANGQPGSMLTIGKDKQSFCFLFGTTALFDSTKLKQLYPTHTAYANAVGASADAAQAQGFLLPPDVALIKKAAQASTVGN